MLGLLYIALCFLAGCCLQKIFIPWLDTVGQRSFAGKETALLPFFVKLPAWYTIGTLFVTWSVYLVSYAFSGKEEPLLYGNVIGLSVWFLFILLCFLFLFPRLNRKRGNAEEAALMLHRSLRVNRQYGLLLFLLIVTFFVSELMFRTFHVTDGTLHVGLSVFSDFAPHLGMIRSFSVGNNFPTQYSHFAGEDIRYHFMFQFLAGNLEYLGMRIDFAFNIPSIISMVSVYLLLFTLAVKITGRRLCGYLTALFFTFRSSFTVFRFLAEQSKEGLKQAMKETDTFIGYTTNETWGLWNLNVYCNQRHLAFSLAILLLALILFLPYVYAMADKLKAAVRSIRENNRQKEHENEHEKESTEISAAYEKLTVSFASCVQTEQSIQLSKVLVTADGEKEEKPDIAEHGIRLFVRCFQTLFLSKTAFSFQHPLFAVFMGVFLGGIAFWNGSVLIAAMIMLFFMAALSERRLDYLLTAVVALVIGILQSKLFVDGSAVALAYQYGFLADNKTFFGTLKYMFDLTGILIPVLFVAFFLVNGTKRYLMLVFSTPIILAFTTALTVDVTVNHKFIMMALMLLSIYPAILVTELIENCSSVTKGEKPKKDWYRTGIAKKLLAVLMIVVLTATGFFEYRIVERRNLDTKNLAFTLDDPLTLAIMDNTDSQDIFLTSWYSLNNVVLGGAMLYFGWPYYAWSAGYNTNVRERIVKQIYEADDVAELKRLVKENNIRYIIVDADCRTNQSYDVREDIIRMAFAEVYSQDEGQWKLTVYDTQSNMKWRLR